VKPVNAAHDRVIQAFLNLPTSKQERLANAFAASEYADPMTLTSDQYVYLTKLHQAALDAGMTNDAKMVEAKLIIAQREGRHNA
jgi:hypothetical protein